MGTVLSVVMVAALALLAGAVFLWRRGGARRQVVLLLVLAVVMIVNVLIWALPQSGGTAPMDRAAQGGLAN